MARLGRVTSSEADNILPLYRLTGGPKKDNAEGRRGLMRRLLGERLTGRPGASGPPLSSPSMDFGTNWEDLARQAYADATGQVVRTVGFVTEGDDLGDSPDGLIWSRDETRIIGALELKVPNTDTHLGYREDGVIPNKYLRQCLHHLLVTGAEWCDFVSYDPRLAEKTPHLALFACRLGRDARIGAKMGLSENLVVIEEGKRMLDIYTESVREFVSQLKEEEQRLRGERKGVA